MLTMFQVLKNAIIIYYTIIRYCKISVILHNSIFDFTIPLVEWLVTSQSLTGKDWVGFRTITGIGMMSLNDCISGF